MPVISYKPALLQPHSFEFQKEISTTKCQIWGKRARHPGYVDGVFRFSVSYEIVFIIDRFQLYLCSSFGNVRCVYVNVCGGRKLHRYVTQESIHLCVTMCYEVMGVKNQQICVGNFFWTAPKCSKIKTTNVPILESRKMGKWYMSKCGKSIHLPLIRLKALQSVNSQHYYSDITSVIIMSDKSNFLYSWSNLYVSILDTQ